MNHTTLAMLSALVCCSTLTPADAVPGQETDVLSQVDKFSFLVGDWNCTGKVLAHGRIAAHPTSAQAHGTRVVEGRWILFRYDEDKTAGNPRPFYIDQYFGYDTDTKRFVSVALDSGGYFSETSPAWDGDSITFDETAAGKVVGHDTFARKSQDQISHVGRDLNKEGQWVETDEEICRKTR